MLLAASATPLTASAMPLTGVATPLTASVALLVASVVPRRGSDILLAAPVRLLAASVARRTVLSALRAEPLWLCVRFSQPGSIQVGTHNYFCGLFRIASRSILPWNEGARCINFLLKSVLSIACIAKRILGLRFKSCLIASLGQAT
jgi:hypothetical protein